MKKSNPQRCESRSRFYNDLSCRPKLCFELKCPDCASLGFTHQHRRYRQITQWPIPFLATRHDSLVMKAKGLGLTQIYNITCRQPSASLPILYLLINYVLIPRQSVRIKVQLNQRNKHVCVFGDSLALENSLSQGRVPNETMQNKSRHLGAFQSL